ncbi:hypothetical protein WN48_09105 [Eufriesea mexicana]|uniref:Uncharacterized protein n=1 Tax=Eufriesea mexicana TaxID=516756 RepID=A0A310SK26_9HYME|nr:hypothetical protein WN48_09105 [Eufriesea mexicana]
MMGSSYGCTGKLKGFLSGVRGGQCHEFVSGTALLRIVRVVWEFPRDSVDGSRY